MRRGTVSCENDVCLWSIQHKYSPMVCQTKALGLRVMIVPFLFFAG